MPMLQRASVMISLKTKRVNRPTVRMKMHQPNIGAVAANCIPCMIDFVAVVERLP